MFKPRPWIPDRKYLTLNQPRRQRLVGDLLCNHGILVPLSDCWCGSAAPDFFGEIWRRSETGRAPWTVRLKAAVNFWDKNIIGGFNTHRHTDIYIYTLHHISTWFKVLVFMIILFCEFLPRWPVVSGYTAQPQPSQLWPCVGLIDLPRLRCVKSVKPVLACSFLLVANICT